VRAPLTTLLSAPERHHNMGVCRDSWLYFRTGSEVV
jgi:hypothetical protein